MDKPYVTVGELAEHLGCQVLGNKNKKIFEISLYQDSNEDSLTYVPYQKINQIPDIGAGAILTKVSIGLPLHRNYIMRTDAGTSVFPEEFFEWRTSWQERLLFRRKPSNR